MLTHAHIFWTASGTKLAKLVAKVDGGPWTHVGVLFISERGDRMAFEARNREGWTGPYLFRATERYIEKREGKIFVTPPLPLTSGETQRAYGRAVELGQTSKPYSHTQLWWLWMRKRYHVRVPKSPKRTICSEGVARVFTGLGPCPEWEHPDGETPATLWRWYCEAVARSHGFMFGTEDMQV